MLRAVCCITQESTLSVVRAALSTRADISVVRERSEVAAKVREIGASIILAEIVDAHGRPLSRHFTDEWIGLDVPILAIVRPLASDTNHIVRTVRSGASIAILQIDDVTETVSRLEREQTSHHHGEIVAAIERALGTHTLLLLTECVADPRTTVDVRGLAIALGCSTRTLERRFERAGVRKPGTVIRWFRIMLAVECLRRTQLTVAEVAVSYGYSSAAAFRTALWKLTGSKPRETRTAEGFQCALVAFEAALSSLSCESTG